MKTRFFLACFLFTFPLMASAGKMNVLFISVDDLNDWISCMGGHPQADTPNIDRLAKQGMLFTNAHAAAALCNPSRTAIMTGLHPVHTGVYSNYVNPHRHWREFVGDVVTLPQHFKANGYHAIGSGKIYHGTYPDPPSWDAFVPSLNQQRFPESYPLRQNKNGLDRRAFDWGSVPIEDQDMADSKSVDFVIEQLSKSHDTPLFLACGIYRPHLPWYVPQSYFDRFPLEDIQLPKVMEQDLADVPPAGIVLADPDGDHRAVTQGGQWKAAVQGYLASVAFADAQVGRVLDALEKSPMRDNTIIILWSDHGWQLGEKQAWRKFDLWERATKAPLIIVAPGVTQADSRSDKAVGLIDIYPTLVDLCGLPKKEGLFGRSLVPLLKDPATTWDHPVLTARFEGNYAVRSNRYRYIRYKDGGEELYDHQYDPHEWFNIAGCPESQPVIRALSAHLPEDSLN